MKLTHIIEAQQFSREWMEEKLFPLTEEMEKIAQTGGESYLAGKRMITFFYEPSTRTHASFQIAMFLLGGLVVFSTENAAQFSEGLHCSFGEFWIDSLFTHFFVHFTC